jgi:Flp pilus assembly protein TadD
MVHKTVAAVTLVLVFGVATPRADARSDAKAQVEFGIEVAQRGLWQEAMYRWQRAVDIDPTYAPAWNNLGIAFEHEGRFDEAREAYETALDLEPNNLYIEQNYDLFLEVNDRASQSPR